MPDARDLTSGVQIRPPSLQELASLTPKLRQEPLLALRDQSVASTSTSRVQHPFHGQDFPECHYQTSHPHTSKLLRQLSQYIANLGT